MDIRIDDLRGPEIAELLQEHLRDMHRVSPPESIHALDLKSLRQPEIAFGPFGMRAPQRGVVLSKNSTRSTPKSNRCARPLRTGARAWRNSYSSTCLMSPSSVATHG